MPEARRQDIDELVGGKKLLDNPGLFLNRYLRNYEKVNPGPNELTAQTAHFQRVADATVSPGYQLAFERWKRDLARLDGVVLHGAFTVNGYMVVGLGSASVLENAITVNRNWGMPLIPGSALKGLASHFLSQSIAQGDPDLRPAVPLPDAKKGERAPLNRHGILFGSPDEASYVNWMDAWFAPKSAGEKPYVFDILTPHHQGYSGSRGESGNPPWDFDDPVPVPFLVSQGTFHIAIQAPDRAIAGFAFEVLKQALAESGIGAKTAAGYGHGILLPVEVKSDPQGEPVASGTSGRGSDIDAFLLEIAEAKSDDLRTMHANAWCVRWAGIENASESKQVAAAIYQRWQQKQSVLNWVRKKGYAKSLLQLMDDPGVEG